MMFEQHDDYKPVTWVGGNPIYAAHFIVGFFSLTMIIAAVLGTHVTQEIAGHLAFLSSKVHGGQVWRVLTYGLVNPPTIPFVIEMVMLIWFGLQLERFFGRKVFLTFFGLLYLLVPVVLSLLGFFREMPLIGVTGGFGCFIAFATLYPGALLIFNIPAKWLALIAIGISSLLYIYARAGVALIDLWATVGFAYSFVRYHQGRWAMPNFSWPKRTSKLRIVPRQRDPDEPLTRADFDDDETESEMDSLLDKIARNGLASLTPNERARLELAREELLKKERQ